MKVSVAQRRARLMTRHRLSRPAATVAEAVEAMVVLHGTDPVTGYLSARARVSGATIETVDDALYRERAIVRMLGMRRTVFIVPAGLIGVIQAACTDDVGLRLRRQLEKDLAAGGVGGSDPAGWLRDVGEGVLRALAARGGGATGAELSEDEPRLRTQLVYAADKSYGGATYITSRVLVLLAAEGHLVRGHRRGGWSSGQFEWYPARAWLNAENPVSGAGGAADGVPPDAGAARDGMAVPDAGAVPDAEAVPDVGTVPNAEAAPDAGAARVELARRWLLAFGPAPVSDLQWWAGWNGRQTEAVLAALPVREVDLDGQPGVLLAGDEAFDDDEAAAPVAALLPALDPTPMGWQARDWFLGPHREALFDRTGNIGPTVWWGGRVVGGWAQRPSGEVVWRLLEEAGADAAAAAAAEAARLEAWLGPARVTPRFRTPLERELTA